MKRLAVFLRCETTQLAICKLVNSLSRPGGNITGFSNIATDLTAKRLEIFKHTVVGMSRVAALVNSNDPDVAQRTIDDVEGAAATLNLTVEPIWDRNSLQGEMEGRTIAGKDRTCRAVSTPSSPN